jgi:hypothetical protein
LAWPAQALLMLLRLRFFSSFAHFIRCVILDGLLATEKSVAVRAVPGRILWLTRQTILNPTAVSSTNPFPNLLMVNDEAWALLLLRRRACTSPGNFSISPIEQLARRNIQSLRFLS